MSTDAALLETGWEPTTPADDTLLRRFLFNWAAATETVAAALGGRALRRDDLVAADLGRAAGFYNAAILLRPLEGETVDDVLAALATFYGFAEGGRSGTVAVFSAWPTPDLRPFGWTLMGHPPLHLLAAGRSLPLPPAGLRIEEVEDGAGLRVFEEIVGRGYPAPELLDAPLLDGRLLGDERMRFWIGWENDRPVAAASAFVDQGINDVTLVATIPEARRRGYGEALTWRAALADPALPAMLLSSDPGRPVYERMGFLPLFRCTGWYRERPGGAS